MKFWLCCFTGSITSSEVDLTERICSEHISDQVDLKWTLAGTETQGVTLLNGISLSPIMLGLITVAPLQWGMALNYITNNISLAN